MQVANTAVKSKMLCTSSLVRRLEKEAARLHATLRTQAISCGAHKVQSPRVKFVIFFQEVRKINLNFKLHYKVSFKHANGTDTQIQLTSVIFLLRVIILLFRVHCIAKYQSSYIGGSGRESGGSGVLVTFKSRQKSTTSEVPKPILNCQI